jgi:hypothetical protein
MAFKVCQYKHSFVNKKVTLSLKTVYTLEVNRRSNDKKIIALYVDMKDMMTVLVQYVSGIWATIRLIFPPD